MERILLDTNIFLDFYWNRKDSVKPLGEFAFKLIQEAIGCKYFVLSCKSIIEEIKNVSGLSDEEVHENILKGLEKANKFEILEESSEQVQKAKELSNLKQMPLCDALIVILAKETNAIIISRDIHFQRILDSVEVLKPEELV